MSTIKDWLRDSIAGIPIDPNAQPAMKHFMNSDNTRIVAAALTPEALNECVDEAVKNYDIATSTGWSHMKIPGAGQGYMYCAVTPDSIALYVAPEDKGPKTLLAPDMERALVFIKGDDGYLVRGRPLTDPAAVVLFDRKDVTDQARKRRPHGLLDGVLTATPDFIDASKQEENQPFDLVEASGKAMIPNLAAVDGALKRGMDTLLDVDEKQIAIAAHDPGPLGLKDLQRRFENKMIVQKVEDRAAYDALEKKAGHQPLSPAEQKQEKLLGLRLELANTRENVPEAVAAAAARGDPEVDHPAMEKLVAFDKKKIRQLEAQLNALDARQGTHVDTAPSASQPGLPKGGHGGVATSSVREGH